MSEASAKPAKRLSDRAAFAYKQLVVTSAALNGETDEFARTVTSLDDVLGKLGLGVECWVRIETWAGLEPMTSIHHEIGYARVSRRWGIALRSWTEHDSGDSYDDAEERWLFNDAPRVHRLAAIEKVPELLEELVKKANAAVRRVQTSTAQARNIVEAVREAANEMSKPQSVLDALAKTQVGAVVVEAKASPSPTTKSQLPITPWQASKPQNPLGGTMMPSGEPTKGGPR